MTHLLKFDALEDIMDIVNISEFVDAMRMKYAGRKQLTTEALEASWKINCEYLNKTIITKNKAIKYVIPAPTGSGKTESLITYCSLLPKQYKALISTNLRAEADQIAEKINCEASNTIACSCHSNTIDCSYHSNTNLTINEAKDFQVVIVTHEYYKRNYTGNSNWKQLGEERDLIVIDEMLDTLKDISVDQDDLERVLTVFRHIENTNKKLVLKDLDTIIEFRKILKESEEGTTLHSSTKKMKLSERELPSLRVHRTFVTLLEILGQNILSERGMSCMAHYGKNIKFNKILTGKHDPSEDKRLHNEIIEIIYNLLEFNARQVYITSNNNIKSFNRVLDSAPDHSTICFDATANVNETYKLRQQYYDDVEIAELPNNIRDYSNVTLHTIRSKTGKTTINKDVALQVLESVILGDKTLIVTHKLNEAFFSQAALTNYPTKTIEVAHWGAITGLNDWKDFDTCVIVGLNHKPRYYSQNRTIVNTDNEQTAFGTQQNQLNNSIEISSIIAEMIQAINRIRVRQITDSEGGCAKANIYITLPYMNHVQCQQQIIGQMSNINAQTWNLQSSIVYENQLSSLEILVTYLNGNLNGKNKIDVREVKDKLGINAETFRTLIGKNDQNRQKFRAKLNQYKFDMTEIIEKDKQGRPRKTPTRYFTKI